MIAVSSNGKSFRALAAYLAAGRSGKERDRVAWTAGRNLPTDDPEIAAKVMRATAAQSRRVEVPVYHLTISFDPQDKDQVTRAMMERVADAVLARLGLAEHEAVYVAHQDRSHPHVHVMVNRVHPETGRAWERWQDQPVIQRVLREQERALGLTIVPGRLAEIEGHPAPERAALTSGERRQAERTGEPAFLERVRGHVGDYRAATSWRDLEALLAEDGLKLERKGQGLIITDGSRQVKASRVARDLSLKRLETRFGVLYGERGQEPPVSPAVARVARDLRTLDRREGDTMTAYHTRLGTSLEARRLVAMEAAAERAHRTSADFDRGLSMVYCDPAAARKAFEEHVATVGRGHATRQFVDAPERFGALQAEGRLRMLRRSVFQDDSRARTAAAHLPALAEAAAQARDAEPASYDLASLRATVRRLKREHQEMQDMRVRLPGKEALETAVTRGVSTLLPHELRRLQQLVTAPQFEITRRLRATAQEVLLGYEIRERA
jgi:hypothetical protein